MNPNRRTISTGFIGLCAALLIGVLAGIFALMWSASTPALAQGGVVFATNTPPPPDPLNIRIDGSMERYALRFWQEQALIDVLASLLNRLTRGENVDPAAVQLTQYELLRRFPGAPTALDQQRRLLALMVNAPPGSVDFRPIARPYIVNALNAQNTSTAGRTSMDVGGFMVELTPLNVNGDGTSDALAYVRYPAEVRAGRDIVYEDYFLLLGGGGGRYALPAGSDQLIAAPFGDVADISLGRIGDVNQNGLDELAVFIDRGEINQELRIYGWRNNGIINLVAPGEAILFGEIADWPLGQTTLTAVLHRVESERWNCLGRLNVEWSWSANFFRRAPLPITALNQSFTDVNTPGCRLHESEPVFARPAAEVISLLEGIVQANSDLTVPGVDRANVALAVAYLLDGHESIARARIEALIPLARDNPWLESQVAAYVNSAAGNFSPVEVCAALVAASPAGACDVDQVLTQLFAESVLTREQPLVPQLEALGLPVLESVTVAQAGRVNREVVRFNLAGASWWGFAPLTRTTYTAEIAPPPRGFEPAIFPQAFVMPPQAAYTALLVNGDAQAALSALENAARDNPGVPLSPAALYLRALSYDFLANRQNARQGYFRLWEGFPESPWGLLAGAHLERR